MWCAGGEGRSGLPGAGWRGAPDCQWVVAVEQRGAVLARGLVDEATAGVFGHPGDTRLPSETWRVPKPQSTTEHAPGGDVVHLVADNHPAVLGRAVLSHLGERERALRRRLRGSGTSSCGAATRRRHQAGQPSAGNSPVWWHGRRTCTQAGAYSPDKHEGGQRPWRSEGAE